LKKFGLKTVVALVFVSTLLTSSVVYVLAQTPTATFWITAGLYPQASYTIWNEGVNYFAKDEFGRIMFADTNASAVLNDVVDDMKGAAIAAGRNLCAGKILIANDITLTDPIDLTDIESLTISGYGRTGASNVTLQMSDNIVFDTTNSRNLRFENIQFSVASGSTPAVVFYLARGAAAASVGDSTFYNVHFLDLGGVTTAFIYNYGSELNTFTDCTFNPIGRAVWLTVDNAKAAINSTYANELIGSTSTSMNSFLSCNFYGGSATAALILLEDGVYHHSFLDSYFGGGSQYAVFFNVTSGYLNKPIFKNNHFEMLGFTGENNAGGTSGITGFTFIDNTISTGGAGNHTFFDFYDTGTDPIHLKQAWIKGNLNTRSGTIMVLQGGTIDYSEIDFRTDVYRMAINASAFIRYSRIVVYSAGYIICSGGFVAVNGTYFSTAGDFP